MTKEEVARETKADAEFARHYAAWLASRMRSAAMSEEAVLAEFTMSRLKDSVSEGAMHARNTKITESAIDKTMERGFLDFFPDRHGELKALLVPELELLPKSPTLALYAKGRLAKLDETLSRIQILATEPFERTFFETSKEREMSTTESMLNIDFAKGFYTSATGPCLRFGSGANLSSIHPAVHEVMHGLAATGFAAMVGPVLNEGLTELITRRVIGEVQGHSRNARMWRVTGDAYASERERTLKVAQGLGPGGLEKLVALYFDLMGGPSDALDALLAAK